MNWSTLFSTRQKSLLILIDPDKDFSDQSWQERFELIARHKPDGILLGGSRLDEDHSEKIISLARTYTNLPVIAFPGDFGHVSPNMDGALFLSLISGRNPEYLIGQHVKHGLSLRDKNIPVFPTGYILIDGQRKSAVSTVTQTEPIAHDDIAPAVATAVAGEMLGLHCIYLEAGSGARQNVTAQMVSAVKKQLSIPLIVGGGIKNAATALEIYKAGADLIVVGNGFENDPYSLSELCGARNSFRT